MPESQVKSSGETRTLSWDEIAAKFTVHGIPPQHMRQLTLKQIHYALREWNEDLKIRIKLAGGEVEEEDREATLQDLMAFGMM